MKEYTLVEAIETIQDPRRQASCWYPLAELIFQIFVGIVCNAHTFSDIRLFVSTHWEWFLDYIPMEAGLPDESTYRRALAIVDPEHMHKMFTLWMQTVVRRLRGLICIDGKTERGSGTSSKKPSHIVSALAETRRQVIAQVAVNTKSNEIKAIPVLLDMLAIRGCIISMDAMGTQYLIAQIIHEKGAFYLLTLKDNQRWLQDLARRALDNVINSINTEALPEKVIEYTIEDQLMDGHLEQSIDEESETDLSQDKPSDDIPCSKVVHLLKKDGNGNFAMSREEGHGREELRKAYILNNISWLSPELQEKWGKPTGVGVIFKTTQYKKSEKPVESVSWYVYSIPNMTAEKLLLYRRGHWAVEEMHNTLDVVFEEDACHAHWENIAENYNVIRHCANNALKQASSVKGSVAHKRYHCSIDKSCLDKVMASIGIYPTRHDHNPS